MELFAIWEWVVCPIVAYLIYKKQLEKFGGEVFRKSGKKSLSAMTFWKVSFVLFGMGAALVILRMFKVISYM